MKVLDGLWKCCSDTYYQTLHIKGLRDRFSFGFCFAGQDGQVYFPRPIQIIASLMGHPGVMRMQFGHAAQYGKVTGPRHVQVLKMIDGFKRIGKIQPRLSASHVLLAGGRHLVGQIGVDQNDGTISRGFHHLFQQWDNAGIGPHHALGSNNDKDVILTLNDLTRFLVASFVGHVFLTHGPKIHKIAHHALVFFAFVRLPIHHLNQFVDAIELLGNARENSHTHAALHTEPHSNILFRQPNANGTREFQNGPNAIGIHGGVHFGELRNHLHAIRQLALRTKNDRVYHGFGTQVVKVLSDITIVRHLIEVQAFLEFSNAGTAELRGQLNQFARHVRIRYDPTQSVEASDNVVNGQAVGIIIRHGR
mmetsp:Transcript_7230/g.20167  ORF Transcript_7230/g.20167 Transcript_7230/m.20167 type:complete len:363 (-) Transcript_7230:481-1569(-)